MTIDSALRDLYSGSGPVALVTVARVSGSAPRHEGSRMAVRPDGTTAGTVGGGKPEFRARQEALSCLASGRNAALSVEMIGAEATGTDLICGGVAEMWIEIVEDRSLYAAAGAAIERGEAVVIASSAEAGCVAVVGGDGSPIAGSALGLDEDALSRGRGSGLALIGADGLLYTPIEPLDSLLILGGGHVGLALARAASALSFRTTVADPRPEFADPTRFPPDVECIASGFTDAIEGFRFGPATYVVIVSPGHLGDLECARTVIRKEYRYAGFIGSRRKSRMLIEELVAEGVDREKAEALRAPIGLDIGAETPEEIAVAIVAEMIAVRRNAPSLAGIDAERKRRRAP
jgi:xanthine dehydrogenase accessory factor